jgi:hypothetical protein
MQGIQLILGNPNPGDTIFTGTPLQISGIAYDIASTSGSGISSVTVYLGDRNAGGIALGTALLGQPSPQGGPGTQFANSGFSLRTPNMPAGSGGRTIFVYARSSITNVEAVLSVPVYLNLAPTPVRGQVPTPVLPPPPACTPTPAPTATAAPAAPTAVPAATAAPAAPVTGVAPAPTLAPISTPTPFPTLPPLTAPAAAAPAAATKPQAGTTPAAVSPALAQTTAPRGGGIPSELGLALLAGGALVVGGGMALRRRQRRATPEEGDTVSTS